MKAPRGFSRDPGKEAKNVDKHGMSLDRAKDLEFATAQVAVDIRQDYGEIREVALGFIDERLHVLVFTMRDDVCHAISLRRANRRELRRYVENSDDA